MKNFFTLLLFCCLFLSCSDDNAEATYENQRVASSTTSSTTSFPSNPEANSVYNNSYKGIYKGIVIGHVSGSLYVNIQNDGRTWAKFQTDTQQTYVLENVTSIDIEDEEEGILYDYRKYRFANENMSFVLWLDDYGNNITTSNFLFFSSNSSKICLLKEKSNLLLKCYVGKFNSQNESGNINFITDGLLKVRGLSKKSNSLQITNISGEISLVDAIELTKIGDDNDDDSPTQYYQLNANLHMGEISGYLKRNKFEGYWTYEDSQLGSWNANRIQ